MGPIVFMSNTSEAWKDFLNPDTLRSRMLSASLFLVAHELLRAAVVDRLHDFFCNGFDENGATFSPEYENSVLDLDEKGKRDPWRGSLNWLARNGVLGQGEINAARLCTNARNLFAHELSKIISGRESPDFESLFPTLVNLVIKIDKWWIVNLELDTDPDFDWDYFDSSTVVPGSQLFLTIIHQSAIGDINAARHLYEQFIEAMG